MEKRARIFGTLHKGVGVRGKPFGWDRGLNLKQEAQGFLSGVPILAFIG